jgi:hypothetical protein
MLKQYRQVYDKRILYENYAFIEIANAQVAPMVVVVAKYNYLSFEERKLNLINSVSYFKI